MPDVKPNGNVRKLCTLQLVNGGGISGPNWIGRDISALFHIVRDGIHGQVATCLCLHMDAPRIWVVAFDFGLHAINEICFLVDIARDVHTHACVQPHLQGFGRPSSDQLVVVVLGPGSAKTK